VDYSVFHQQHFFFAVDPKTLLAQVNNPKEGASRFKFKKRVSSTPVVVPLSQLKKFVEKGSTPKTKVRYASGIGGKSAWTPFLQRATLKLATFDFLVEGTLADLERTNRG